MPADDPDAGPRVSLAALRDALQRCRECPLGRLATQGVAGEGALRPALMLVGEVPGDQEDLRGHPFVGPAGQLLFRATDSLGWPREALFVTNAVKHFKFELRGKRRIHKTPSQSEAAACLHWLEDEIALVAPRAAIALGATAARSLMRRSIAVTREHGRWLQRDDDLRVLVTLHPSALLRMRGQEREAAYEQWLGDLRNAAQIVDRWARRSPAADDAGAAPRR
jgi:DNA polymerase